MLRPNSIRKKVWRDANTRYDAANIADTCKSVYKSLSVRAACSARGCTTLIKIEGTLKQEIQ